MMFKNKLLLVAATAVFINSAAPVAQELEESFNCVGKASLKDEMPKDLNKEIKMLLTLLTPIEFTETFEIRDALIEGAKIEISDSKITLAKSFFKKIGKIDTNIHQMEINRSTGAFYLEGEMIFQGTAINVAARGNCTT
tara:strand:- start:838 stop:1254 length:417 start_codon:yes stop_codon:yes gene_type:complete